MLGLDVGTMGALGALLGGMVSEILRRWGSRQQRKDVAEVMHEVKSNGQDNLRARMEDAAQHAKNAAEASNATTAAVSELGARVGRLEGRVGKLEEMPVKLVQAVTGNN